MYLVYMDESGSHDDGSYTNGLPWQPTNKRESKYFVLTGLVVHKENWRNLFVGLKSIRQNVRVTHGIPISEYIHANELITGKGKWQHKNRKDLTRAKRIRLLKNLLHEYAQL